MGRARQRVGWFGASPRSGDLGMSVTPWQAERSGLAVRGVGAPGLLGRPLTAFFASRRCPGAAIRAAADGALSQARARHAVISGFHSPLEQSVLRLLNEAGSPAVIVLARPVDPAALRVAWRGPLAAGTLAIVSQTNVCARLTAGLAERRDDLAAELADDIVIAHADPGGHIAQQSQRWLAHGMRVRRLLDCEPRAG